MWGRLEAKERAARAAIGPGLAVYLSPSGYCDAAYCGRCAPEVESGWTVMPSDTETVRGDGPSRRTPGCESCGRWPKCTPRPKRAAGHA